MTPEEKQLLIVRLVSLAGFTSLNTGLNFYNSWLLKPDTEVKVNVSLTPAVSAEGAQQLLAGYGTGVGSWAQCPPPSSRADRALPSPSSTRCGTWSRPYSARA